MSQTRPITAHSKRALSLDGGRVIGTPTKSIAANSIMRTSTKNAVAPMDKPGKKKKKRVVRKIQATIPLSLQSNS
jgi:hypothetical protein